METDYAWWAQSLSVDARREVQMKLLQSYLAEILRTNEFYKEKYADVGLTSAADLSRIEDFGELPFTAKRELSEDQEAHPPYGRNLTYPRAAYTRVHQTSGTSGKPLRWLDDEGSWHWWIRCWEAVYRAAGISAEDRIFFAFSFGPFIGFWSAYDAAQSLGALAIPGGGMSSYQRLVALLDHEVTVLICTPTYALHLAEVAESEGIDLRANSVRTTVHAGEPGGSIPATKRRMESLWGVSCFDHAGATEVGAWGFECEAHDGVHVNESEFIAEVIDPGTGAAAQEGELVLTNLGRAGMPVIRYRTGDYVRPMRSPCRCGRTFIRLQGGVLGRTDDVLIVRGINVFPSAIENIIRRFPEVSEFSVTVDRPDNLDVLEIKIEVKNEDSERVVSAIHREVRNALGLRAEVKAIDVGALPRFDLKARRFSDRRRRDAS